MKRLLLYAFLLLPFIGMQAQKVDPYHTATGGFGYPVHSSSSATVWWAEGAYKVMQDMPAPKGKPKGVSLGSARNEWE